MNNLSFDDFIEYVNKYNPDEVIKVTKAYKFAESYHYGQKRQSGEDYIIHPLNVAYILAEMHADGATLCAGLLHDTLEDTKATKEDIVNEFGSEVASLVDGVTNISKLNFSSKEDENNANIRKILTGITSDVRIIIIKLADRLHNMRTLEFKNPIKQKENALETMEIYAPLADYMGAYRIKSELEDISLKYLKPDSYNMIVEEMQRIELDTNDMLQEMMYKIQRILNNKEIPNEIKIRMKNVYGIYKRLNEGRKLLNIHDLLALKIMVDNIDNCYLTLGVVHSLYNPRNEKMKDYLYNEKPNKYRSLHTTVFADNNYQVQAQIRTFQMDKVASFGLTAYWDIEKGEARKVMQEELKRKFQFYKSLIEIDSMFQNNVEFISKIKSEVFSPTVSVRTKSGEIFELPIGSTIIDFAYNLDPEIGNKMISSIVNNDIVPFNYVLQSRDRVRIITDESSVGPNNDWLNIAQTTYAKQMIKNQLVNK